jgi:hypothetical protein
MRKTLGIFVDESGDFGFRGEASKYYLFTLVFHDQALNLQNNLAKMSQEPVFHAGPLIRQEDECRGMDPLTRKKHFQKMYSFVSSLPIKVKTFSYDKRIFEQDLLKMGEMMSLELFEFLIKNQAFFLRFSNVIVYYDRGQGPITRMLIDCFEKSGLSYSFKENVTPMKYRLLQVADFVSSVRLLEIKMNAKELSPFEEKFIDRRHLRRIYLRTLNKMSL